MSPAQGAGGDTVNLKGMGFNVDPTKDLVSFGGTAAKVQLEQSNPSHDTLLLCTDGLNRHVSDERIAQALAQELPATETCHELVGAANEGGGTDNTTVVVARFTPRRQAEAPRLVAAERERS